MALGLLVLLGVAVQVRLTLIGNRSRGAEELVAGGIFSQAGHGTFNAGNDQNFGDINFYNGEHRMHLMNRRRRANIWIIATVAVIIIGAAGALTAHLSQISKTPAGLLVSANYQMDHELPKAVHPKGLVETEFPNDRDCRYVADWTVAQGGAYASGTPIRLTMTNKGGSVVIHRITVRVTDRKAAPLGTSFTCDSAGIDEPIPLAVDLDETTPVVRKATDDGTRGEIFASHTVVKLTNDEIITFDIIASTVDCLCRWQIDIVYITDGRQQTLTVTAPGGEDFQTAADSRTSRRYSSLGGGVWREGD